LEFPPPRRGWTKNKNSAYHQPVVVVFQAHFVGKAFGGRDFFPAQAARPCGAKQTHPCKRSPPPVFRSKPSRRLRSTLRQAGAGAAAVCVYPVHKLCISCVSSTNADKMSQPPLAAAQPELARAGGGGISSTTKRQHADIAALTRACMRE
jgi:hypothetical protein